MASTSPPGGAHHEHAWDISPHVVTSRSHHSLVISEQHPHKHLLRIFFLDSTAYRPHTKSGGLFNRDDVPDTRHMNLYSVSGLWKCEEVVGAIKKHLNNLR